MVEGGTKRWIEKERGGGILDQISIEGWNDFVQKTRVFVGLGLDL